MKALTERMAFDLPTGFVTALDDHGALRIAMNHEQPLSPFVAVVGAFDVDEAGNDLSDLAAKTTATHRVMLTDARVLHVESSPAGLFGAPSSTVILCYRAGDYSYTLHTCLSIRDDLGAAFNVTAVSMSSDYPDYLPLIDRIIASGSIAEEVA